jgi:metal-responsive CopG/Arc/MetJ family transcriptional regulator
MKNVNMRFPEELLQRLDAYCKANFTNRTEVVKRLLLEFLNKQEKPIE